jgi:hypothetical protein
MEIYLHSPIRLNGVVLNIADVFMERYLVKHRDNFTFLKYVIGFLGGEIGP